MNAHFPGAHNLAATREISNKMRVFLGSRGCGVLMRDVVEQILPEQYSSLDDSLPLSSATLLTNLNRLKIEASACHWPYPRSRTCRQAPRPADTAARKSRSFGPFGFGASGFRGLRVSGVSGNLLDTASSFSIACLRGLSWPGRSRCSSKTSGQSDR